MIELSNRLWWVGVQDKNESASGTTYNSYLLKAGDKTVLFGTVPQRFLNEWYEDAVKCADGKNPDFIVLDTNYNFNCVKHLLKNSPDITVIGTQYTVHGIKSLMGGSINSVSVRNNDTVAAGDITLRFTVAPIPMRPAALYTFIEQEKAVVSPDLFGADCICSDMRADLMPEKEYIKAAGNYLISLHGELRLQQIRKTLADIRSLAPEIICPMNGPVIEGKMESIFALYEQFCQNTNPFSGKTVAVIYEGRGPFVKLLADSAVAGLTDASNGADGLNVKMYDISSDGMLAALEEVRHADAYLFGVTSFMGEAGKDMWEFAASMRADTHGSRPMAVFGSSGTDDSGIHNISERLLQLDLRPLERPFVVKYTPAKDDIKNTYEFGYNIGCILAAKPNPHRAGKLVKCLVCGEIFDASLGICPVCGVGLDQCVAVEEESISFGNNTNLTYVIIGGGSAALSAATAIRDRDKTGRVLMLSAESYAPINRPKLTKDNLTRLPIDKAAARIAVKEPDWFTKNNVELRLGTLVTEIDVPGKTVTVADTETIKYDRLIYALGAECALPPFPGCGLPEVTTIRHMEDVEKIAAFQEHAKNVVVIGGGVQGLEAAWEQKMAHRNVTVIDAAPRLMGAQLDEFASQMLMDCCTDAKVDVKVGVSVNSICGQEHVTGVALGDGSVIPADLVIIACGNKANIALARSAGIATDRGVLVNGKMATDIPDIYACGDCAEYEGVNYQLWSEALEQGRVAGANASGDKLSFVNVPLGMSFHGMRTKLFAIGDVGRRELAYKTVELRDEAKRRYLKYWFVDDTLQGAILLGDVDDVPVVTEAIEKKKKFCEIF